MAPHDPIRRLLQQAILAELSLRVIGAEGSSALASYAARAVADAVDAPVVGIFELEQEALVLRAGVGWPEDLPGRDFLGSDDAHTASALASSEPIPINGDLPEGLRTAGVVAGLPVDLQHLVERTRRGRIEGLQRVADDCGDIKETNASVQK